jgi:hypothetical protein
MSKTVNVLIAVDTNAAQSSKNLTGNVYLVDTNHFMGSTAEGQPELITTLHNGDTVVWNVQPINPGNDVEISGFTSQVGTIGRNITPAKNADGSWSGQYTETPPVSGHKFQYSVNLTFDNTNQLSFDPFLQTK